MLNYFQVKIKHDACDGHLKKQVNDTLSVVQDEPNVMVIQEYFLSWKSLVKINLEGI